MPNICENTLTIKGSYEDLKKFYKKHIIDDCLDFDTVIPEPKLRSACPMKYICIPGESHISPDPGKPWFNWYDFHLDKWGTKWNSYDCYIPDLDEIKPSPCTEINICFSTAWSPCLPVIKRLIENHPELHLTYSYVEPGMCFAGTIDSDGLDEHIASDSYFDLLDWCVDHDIYDKEYAEGERETFYE